jgi:hypothetical protein
MSLRTEDGLIVVDRENSCRPPERVDRRSDMMDRDDPNGGE